MMRRPLAGLAALTCLIGVQAQASLVTDEVTCSNTSGATTFFCDQAQAVVDDTAGPEFTFSTAGAPQFFAADFFGDSVVLGSLFPEQFSFLQGASITFGSLDWVDVPTGELIGVTLSANTLQGLALTDISISPHEITIDLSGVGVNLFSGATIGFETTHAAIPLPAAGGLLLAALAGMFSLRLHRRAA